MTIVDALKELVTTLGGTYSASDDTISELLDKVNTAFENGGGGASLPAVSGTDNGKVLTVVEGAWNKAAAPTELPAVSVSDNGKYLGVTEGEWGLAGPPNDYSPWDVGFTVSQDGEGHWTATTTNNFADVLAVAAANPATRIVRAKCSFGSGYSFLPIGVVDATDGNEMMIFSAPAIIGSAVVYMAITWTPNNNPSVTAIPLTT